MQKRFKLKKAFSMILFSYIAILMIPAALAVGFSVMANRMSTSRCIDDVSNNIQQGQLLLEKQLEVMDENAIQLTWDYTLKRMQQLEPLQPGDKNVWFVSQFSERLDDIFPETGISYAYCVMLDNEYIFHMNGVSLGLEFYFENFRRYSSMSYEEYREKSFQSAQRTLFPLDSIQLGKDVVRALTYSYPIVTAAVNDGEAGAVVQLLIREEDLRHFFFPLLQKSGSQVILLDGAGNRLAVLAESGMEAAEAADFDVVEMTGSYGSMEAGLGEEQSLLVYRRSEENNLIFAAVVPKTVVLEDARRLQWISFVMMAVCMLLELALGIYFAWKYSAPIRNLIQNVYLMINSGSSDKTQEALEDKSEYEHLESGINQILQSNRTMQMTLKEKQEREKENFLGYLFNGAFEENKDIIREGALIGMKLESVMYCVVSYQLESPKQGAECLGRREWKHVLAVYETGEYLSVLFGLAQEAEKKELAEIIRDMTAYLNNEFSCTLRPGAGRWYTDEKDISFSYMQSVYSASCREAGALQQEIIFYSRIAQDFNSLCYPADLENKLISSSKHGEIQQIQQIFAYIRKENIEKRRLSRSMGKILVYNIVATLLKVYNDVIPNEELDHMINEVLRYSELSEAITILEKQFIRIGEELARSRNEREENYQKRLAAYVEDNYNNPQLGVAMAAEEFTLSENYFSQFFKDVMKESFSSYLEKLRLDKARKLIEEGEYNLERIAGMVGYQNSGTFRRAFKRVLGVSPSAWKEEVSEK